MICYVGAHYLIFLRNPELKVDKYKSSKWKLYNDTEIKEFRNWLQIVTYCIENKCIPTVLIYHKNTERNYYTNNLEFQYYDLLDLE